MHIKTRAALACGILAFAVAPLMAGDSPRVLMQGAELLGDPVVGIPVPTKDLGGMDSLLATVQMPGDVPVVSVAVGLGGPRNAGIFAVQILATADKELRAKLDEFKKKIVDKIQAKNAAFQDQLSS